MNTSTVHARISAVVLTFNQAPFIQEAIHSLLRQTIPVQIVVCDDGSSDETARIAADALESAGWPLGAVLIRHERNLGVTASLNEATSRCTAPVVMWNDGDDWSNPRRAERLLDTLHQSGATLAGSAVQPISESGGDVEGPFFWQVATAQRLQAGDIDPYGRWVVLGASVAFRREAWDKFGELPPGTIMCDKALTHRALALDGIALIPDRLVNYRIRASGLTNWLTYWSVPRPLLRRKLADYLQNSRALSKDLGAILSEPLSAERKFRLSVIQGNMQREAALLQAVLAPWSLRSLCSLIGGLFARQPYTRSYARKCVLLVLDPARHEMWMRLDLSEMAARFKGKIRRALRLKRVAG